MTHDTPTLNWEEPAYGPYENAAEAAAALEVIRAKIDMGRPGGWAWTYTVTPLRSTP
ncbi:hypothetical protein MICRO80W_300001 [Micrococcus luteus]|nr:hypothetical protein MICRO80W_300001 [Micrococcus luteus]